MPEENSKNKIFIFVILACVIPLIIGFGPLLFRGRETSKILENGIPAQAEVLDIKDTGSRFNNNPEVHLFLLVKPEQGDPFKAEVTMVVSIVELSKYQPGKTLPVKFDPEDISKVAVVTD